MVEFGRSTGASRRSIFYPPPVRSSKVSGSSFDWKRLVFPLRTTCSSKTCPKDQQPRRKCRNPIPGAAIGVVAFLLIASAAAQAQTWTPLTNQPSFAAGTTFLMTDGTVLVQQLDAVLTAGNWYRLTPDSTGNYVNGTWTQVASMPSDYNPEYYASAVLADGRLIVEGGEYNQGSQQETNKGAIFDPTVDPPLGQWMPVSPPSGWAHIGDASGVLLANDQFLIGDAYASTAEALLDPVTLTWTPTGAGKADLSTEEGFALLPSGDVLTVDTNIFHDSPTDNTEVYSHLTGTWSTVGSTQQQLWNSGSYEIGPEILLPNGLVLATGVYAVRPRLPRRPQCRLQLPCRHSIRMGVSFGRPIAKWHRPKH